MEYYPSYFKTLVTMILFKLVGEQNYSQAKLYSPITLLNTMSKIFETIVVHKLSHVTKIY